MKATIVTLLSVATAVVLAAITPTATGAQLRMRAVSSAANVYPEPDPALDGTNVRVHPPRIVFRPKQVSRRSCLGPRTLASAACVGLPV